MSAQRHPLITSEEGGYIAQASEEGMYTHHSLYYLDSEDDKVWFGTLSKRD